MKKGHRRTQSANLASALEEPPVLTYQFPPNRKLNVVHLLHQSQLKAKQKVCNVDSLHLVPRSDGDKLFNFGKGLHKANEQVKTRTEKHENLVSIPQKSKTSGRTRKANEVDRCPRTKPKVELRSILKLHPQDTRKGQIDFAEGVNKLIKMKLGEVKQRKLSMYQPGRSTPKQLKHKKEVSNAK